MSINPNNGDWAQADNVIKNVITAGYTYEGRRLLAEAFADARNTGRQDVLDRLGPIIFDAETARQELAYEVSE